MRLNAPVIDFDFDFELPPSMPALTTGARRNISISNFCFTKLKIIDKAFLVARIFRQFSTAGAPPNHSLPD